MWPDRTCRDMNCLSLCKVSYELAHGAAGDGNQGDPAGEHAERCGCQHPAQEHAARSKPSGCPNCLGLLTPRCVPFNSCQACFKDVEVMTFLLPHVLAYVPSCELHRRMSCDDHKVAMLTDRVSTHCRESSRIRSLLTAAACYD